MRLNDIVSIICAIILLAFVGMIIYAKFFIPPIYVVI